MNAYTMADILKMYNTGKGDSRYLVEITKDMLDTYIKLFSHVGAIHTDDNFAREQGFKQRVVPQLLIVSQLLPMVEEHLPGKYGLGLGADNLSFKNPCYIGDTLCFSGTIASVSRAAKMIVLAIVVTNQIDEVVLECQWKVKMLK